MDNWKRILLKAAGIGGGFAVVAAIILGTTVWLSGDPRSKSHGTLKP